MPQAKIYLKVIKTFVFLYRRFFFQKINENLLVLTVQKSEITRLNWKVASYTSLTGVITVHQWKGGQNQGKLTVKWRGERSNTVIGKGFVLRPTKKVISLHEIHRTFPHFLKLVKKQLTDGKKRERQNKEEQQKN